MTNNSPSTPQNYTAVGKKPRVRPSKYLALAIIFLALSFGAGLGGGYLASRFGDTANRTVIADGNAVVSQEEEDISTVASKVGPSVVSIMTKTQAQSYFGTQTVDGAGTGIIISKDG